MSKIFNIIQSNEKGGMENVFLDYSKILKDSGLDVICVVSRNFVYLDELHQNNIKTEILNISGHFDFFAALKLYFLIKKHSPKLIIAHNGRSFACINLCKKLFSLKGAKTLAVSHGGSIKRILKFDYLIAVASHIEQKAKAHNFAGKTTTIHNGIKIANFGAAQKTKNQQLTFGLLSRISKEKNIEIALNSFAKFNQESNKNSKLIIAGDGPDLQKLKDLALQLKIAQNVEFIGWINDKESFFNKIDVFLQTSLNEPFGLTIIESFNYFTPVIAANAFGPKEIIVNGYNGYLFDPKSPESLLDLLKKISEDQNLDSIAKNAYQDLINKFSYDQMAKSLVKFVRHC